MKFARKNRLPKPIANFIPEHQGTLKMGYFFQKAKEKNLDINEYYFRYNSLYFSYLTEGGEGGPKDSRQYFNEKGELIRNLVDVGEGNKNSNTEAYLSNLQYCQRMLLLNVITQSYFHYIKKHQQEKIE